MGGCPDWAERETMFVVAEGGSMDVHVHSTRNKKLIGAPGIATGAFGRY